MKNCTRLVLMWASTAVLVLSAIAAEPTPDRKLRIICFGAHPDDCELQAGGVAALWAAQGHKVKFVSTTSGDIGHWRDSGEKLARRRREEVQACAKVLGNAVEVLDIHDGELMPTLENRRTITRLIRQWQADIVISPRPNDYHPDHRYTAVLVQDSAYMVAVPFFCPETPPLKSNPVYLYYPDRFKKPAEFSADIVVAVDEVMEKKLDALGLLVSQFQEGGALGSAELFPSDPEIRKKRDAEVRDSLARRNGALADRFRGKIAERYGADRAAAVRFVEAFEICEYGRQPNNDELKRLFPF